jgi:5-methylcytosine-specific restriction protein A
MFTKIKDALQGKAPLSSNRSPKWSSVRSKYLKTNSKCAVCSGTSMLNVHHIKPFHTHPELELEHTNLITLCESTKGGVNCHLWFGHLGNYKDINPNVVADATYWRLKLNN